MTLRLNKKGGYIMTSLIINWIIILILGAIIANYLRTFEIFYSGIISLIIAAVITYGIHILIIPAGNLIWALVAVGHASFWAGFFSSLNARK